VTTYRDKEVAKRIKNIEYPHAATHGPAGGDPVILDYGQSFEGTVSGIAGAPKFQCSNLTGFGDEYFKGYWVYVVWDADGLGGVPQGEMLECTGYSSATGDFTVAAYSAAIAVGDKVLLFNEALAATINTVFGLSALKVLLDAITTAGPTNVQMEAARDAIIAAIPAMVGTDGAATVADGWDAALATILDNFSAARVGYLDNIATTAMGRSQIAATTIDLNQAANTYDLFTGTAQAVILESLNIKLPTGAIGGTITGITIQTDDATPGVIIDANAGALANLLTEADLYWTASMYITVGTKIRLTIVGGPAGAGYVCNVTAKCRAVLDGGHLA